ncbi:MAG: chemotaxis protein CheX [Deltaproteobacteria bacterium]|nr:chemotaxis protein CheX [Deltaproteobacteria bacterium]MBW2018942.1 chemotaxis protein CheX [Deltaproteobacteria bacterium]MBW2073157.1 chemotaxis protein CheX [Deltaproteobacteria bacterium]RLB83776.1 MAG: chemotaxis protein CheX [Deltaproteobacteria bacterium]
MDVKYINPFINATINVLETMAFTKAEAGKPYLKKDQVAQGDVTGVIGLIGGVSGTISVSFTEKSILSIVSNMFGEEMKELNEEIKDAVGEITNMISGQARQELEGMGISLKAAIPSVIVGKNHSINHITKHPIIAIPFNTANGGFTIEVCFEK